MKQQPIRRAIWVSFLILTSTSSFAATVQSIDFKVKDGQSYIEVTADDAITFQQQDNPDDKQIVLNLPGAKLSKMASRNLDTSSFNSPVLLVSPYEVEDNGGELRLVIQLRDQATSNVESLNGGKKLQIAVSGGAGQAKQESAEAAPEVNMSAKSESKAPDTKEREVTDSRDNRSAKAEPEEPSKKPLDGIDAFIESRQTRNFTGTAVTLQLRDADIRDILRLIADTSGFNVVVGPDVQGKLSLSLIDVPWDQALDVILQTLKLGAERNNNILRVVTLTSLTREKQEELAAKQASAAGAPRLTRVFPISYASLDDLAKTLSSFGKGSSDDKQTGTIGTDTRTNSVIVQDIAENIDRMSKLIRILDTQTPQVMIEAKVVEATEGTSNSLTGGLFVQTKGGFAAGTFSNIPDIRTSTNSPDPATRGLLHQALAYSAVATGGGTLGANGLFVDQLPLGLDAIGAVLQVLESENKVKIVSSPRTVVLNKQASQILQDTPASIPVTTTSGGVSTTTFTQISAALSLQVTPTVTNDQGVLMNLDIHRDVLIQTSATDIPRVGKRSMTTNVLVDSGSTLVIGGLYTARSTTSSSGFPFLRKLPLIGWLFGADSANTERSELFFFISPRILNIKKAGLSG